MIALACAPPIAAAQDQFARTDAFADAAPASATRSVPALAAYLARSGRDDLTRTRAIYRWVARHIDYDATGFRAGTYGDLSPEAVLRRRVSVCDGYSHLVQALGAAMGLEVQVVSGWSKGYGFSTGEQITGRPNHSWDAIRVDGQWQLMDATWGSGYLDDQLRFVRSFQEHYFLTRPEAFVFDHFPSDSRWQLVAHPISSEDFSDLVYLRPMFFQVGFSLMSHPHARISTDAHVTVSLGISQPVDIIAEVDDPGTDRRSAGVAVFTKIDATHAEVSAAFPKAGDYVLRLFARRKGAEGPLDWVLDYKVHASRGTLD